MQGDVLLPAYTDNTEEIMKELLIFLGGAICGGFVATVVFCVMSAKKFKKIESKNRG